MRIPPCLVPEMFGDNLSSLDLLIMLLTTYPSHGIILQVLTTAEQLKLVAHRKKKLRICICPEGTANADGGRISAIKKAGAIGTQIAEFMGKVMHLLMAMKET